MFNFITKLKDFVPNRFRGKRSKKFKNYIVEIDKESDSHELILNITCRKTNNVVKICLDDMEELYEWADEQSEDMIC